MSDLNPKTPSDFEQLRKSYMELVERGELDRALELCDQALEWALQHGDTDTQDLAICNRSSVLIQKGQGESVIRELQRVLMASQNPRNRYLAAYNISQHYDLLKNFSKSAFYARLALDYAEKTDSKHLVGHSHNRLASILVADSRFDEAQEHFELALALLDREPLSEHGIVLTNIGYCLLVQNRLYEGLEQLLKARKLYIRTGFRWSIAHSQLRLALCYGYIEIDRPHRARLHGVAALAAAQEAENDDLIKKCLYLLGEAEKLVGDEEAAYACFADLQSYYPETPHLPELLMGMETHRLINILV